MTVHPLVQRLAALQGTGAGGLRWTPRAPVPARQIESIEATLGVTLPADLRAVLEASGGGTLLHPGITPLGIGPASDLLSLNEDPFYTDNLPGMIVFGGDGGGGVYFYDPENRLGRGEWAIFIVRMGDLALDAARPVAADLTEAVEAVASGRDPYS